ncbi:Villin-4 [Vitis vinifera]|uniref:Villin-4 n=1 Tax=Vitis vinifera TaxID=29760 RepID=A0A438H8M1_VITVI|nr:Villin-4 [Vitis vinifera]
MGPYGMISIIGWDEAGTAAVKTVELDAALGGRAVQYREVQGHETEKFLSYFKPCIIPQPGGVASGFKHAEAEEHKTRLFLCTIITHHDDIFILDTKSKIFQFNGSNSSIQERAKALEVVQYIKDTYHDGKCEVASIEDGKLMADAETGEFWGFLVVLLHFQGKQPMKMTKPWILFLLSCFGNMLSRGAFCIQAFEGTGRTRPG